MKESLQDQHLFIPPGVVFSVDFFFQGFANFFLKLTTAINFKLLTIRMNC